MVGKQFEFDNIYEFEPRKAGFVNLIQIGELCCESGFMITEHTQVCHEISYIVSGSGVFTTDGVETRVSAGDIYINAKNHLHSIRADENSSLRFFYIAFEFNKEADPQKYGPIIDLFADIGNPLAKDTTDVMTPFAKIMDELYCKSVFSYELFECYTIQILLLTCRAFKTGGKIPSLPAGNINMVGHAVYSVVRYINNNIYNIKNIRCVSEDLGYSYSYLSHLFRKKMGVTISSYLCMKKIEKAVGLIRLERMSITQIAMKLNYETVQSFSKTFKKTMGMSPAEYRKKCVKASDKSEKAD